MADQLVVNALQICSGSVDILRNHRKKKGQNAAEKYLCLTMWKGLGIPLFLFSQVTFNIFIHFLSPQTPGNLIFRKCGPQIIIFNWYSLHARLNSHYEVWNYKKKEHKKIKAHRKPVWKEPTDKRCLLNLNLKSFR